MKHLKMLGLAAVAAMGLMAFLGAGSASATVLCETQVTANCPAGWDVLANAALRAHVVGTAVLETTGGSSVAECTVSNMSGTTTNTGGSTETVRGHIAAANLTWGNVGEGCNQTTDTTAGGELEIHWISGTDNGTVTGKEFDVTVRIFGVSCTYGLGAGTHLGELTGGADPIIHINAIVSGTSGNSFLCPADARWTATYTITNAAGNAPTPIYVSTN